MTQSENMSSYAKAMHACTPPWGSTIDFPFQQVTHDTDQDTLKKKKFPSMSNDYRVLIPTNGFSLFTGLLQNACKGENSVCSMHYYEPSRIFYDKLDSSISPGAPQLSILLGCAATLRTRESN